MFRPGGGRAQGRLRGLRVGEGHQQGEDQEAEGRGQEVAGQAKVIWATWNFCKRGPIG